MDNNNSIQNNGQNMVTNIDSLGNQSQANNQIPGANNIDPIGQPPQGSGSQKKPLLIALIVLLSCIAVATPALIKIIHNDTPSVLEPISPVPAKQQFDGYHIEEYNGEEYYIIDDDYDGEFEIQKGSFTPDESDDPWGPIEEFNTQEVFTFDEYVNFCQKWSLIQNYHDQDKNYIVIAYFSPDSAYIDVRLANVEIDSSKANIFLYDDANGVVADSAYYALFIPVDSTVTSLEITPLITDEELQNIKNHGTTFDPNIIRDDKPIIYLYPTTDAKVSVKLGYPDKLTAVYPTYDDGWRVLAHPDGTLQDLKTGRELYSLYYESQATIDFDHTSEGFVVQGKDSASFLEDKLEILGLTPREAEEFIVYWLPKLESSPYNFIRFATAEEIDTNMPLSITPSPDSIIRVLMVFKPLQSPIEVAEQQLSTPARNGFTVVEWGGVELSNSLMH